MAHLSTYLKCQDDLLPYNTCIPVYIGVSFNAQWILLMIVSCVVNAF